MNKFMSHRRNQNTGGISTTVSSLCTSLSIDYFYLEGVTILISNTTFCNWLLFKVLVWLIHIFAHCCSWLLFVTMQHSIIFHCIKRPKFIFPFYYSRVIKLFRIPVLWLGIVAHVCNPRVTKITHLKIAWSIQCVLVSKEGQQCISLAEHLPSKCEALGTVSRMTEKLVLL